MEGNAEGSPWKLKQMWQDHSPGDLTFILHRKQQKLNPSKTFALTDI